MKIKHILTLIAVMVSLNVWGQSTYNLNYPDIKIGNKADGGKIVLNGSNLQFPRIGLGSSTDSVLTILNGVIRKVPRSSISSPTPSLDQVLNVGFTSELPISVGAIAAGSGSITSAPSQPTHIVRLSDLSAYQPIADAVTSVNGRTGAVTGLAESSSLSNYELLSNKVTSLASPNNTTYPTTQAVSNALSSYQTVSNLSTNLTASATKYPSVNAVNTGLSDKASITIDNIFNSNSSWINTYRRTSDATFYSQAGWDSFRVNRGTAVTQYGFNAISHAISAGNTFNLAFPSSGFTGTLNAIFRPLGGTVAFLSDITSAGSSYELLANKSTSTTLGTSNTLYPTQNAVQTYVNNKVATGQTIGANAATATAPANATSFKTALATSFQEVTNVNQISSNSLMITGTNRPVSPTIGTFVLEYDVTNMNANFFAYDYATLTPKNTIINGPGGNVGIGKNPSVPLDVNGSVKSSGDIEITDTTKGVILRAPDGGRWRLTISNTGVISTTLVP